MNLQPKLYKIKEGENEAVLTVDKMILDVGTMRQIRLLMCDPTVSKPVFMPDVHAGVGSCVGFTCCLTEKVAPAIISGDIGCGITAIKLPKEIVSKYSPSQMDTIIRSLVPIDEGYTAIHDKPVVLEEDLNSAFIKSSEIATLFALNYKSKFNVDITSFIPKYDLNWMKLTCKKIGSDFDYDMRSIGTPRNGNHYVEVNGSNDDYYLSTHCGSCNFGSKIYLYHQSKISDNNKMDWNSINSQMHSLQRKIKVPKLLKQAKDNIVQNMRASLHAPYLEGSDAYEYFFDMIFAQCYAGLNRLTIIKRIFHGFGLEFDPSQIIESVHNYIDFEDMIVRKGAIKLHSNQTGIVALNMRDGFLVICGTENGKIIKDWNYSCCHGCGRDYPRHEAKFKFSMKDYVQSMSGVYSKSIVNETLDECPAAYRRPDIIMDALKGRAEIIGQYPTILNIKGYGK